MFNVVVILIRTLDCYGLNNQCSFQCKWTVVYPTTSNYFSKEWNHMEKKCQGRDNACGFLYLLSYTINRRNN